MVIAVLVLLGVQLATIVVFVASVVGRRRWLRGQPGYFAGAVRLSTGELHGFGPKWRRGGGRWVRGVFVWSKGPFLFRQELVPVDELTGERIANDGEIRRLDDVVVVELVAGDARIEVAGTSADRPLMMGLFGEPTVVRQEHPATVPENVQTEFEA